MEIDGKPLTTKELQKHQVAVIGCIRIIMATADSMDLDRDSYLNAFANQLNLLSEISTFKNWSDDND